MECCGGERGGGRKKRRSTEERERRGERGREGRQSHFHKKKIKKKFKKNAALDLHVNLCHGFNTPGVPSRFEGLDIVVIRENTEGECLVCVFSLFRPPLSFSRNSLKKKKLKTNMFPLVSFPPIRPLSPLSGEYSGLEHEVVPDVVESLKVITLDKSRRTAEYAFGMAFLNNRKKVRDLFFLPFSTLLPFFSRSFSLNPSPSLFLAGRLLPHQ